MIVPRMKRLFKSFGNYLVADPRICHGQWTFRGTRIFVSYVLDQLAAGMSWKKISKGWRGRVTFKGISESVLLTKDLFFHKGLAVRRSMIEIEDHSRAKPNPCPALSRRTGRGKRATGETPVPRRR